MATNKYNVFRNIDNIYNNKVGYETAAKAGDMQKAEEHRKAAQRDYWLMRQNGYSDLANQINNSTAEQTVPIRNHWGKYQKTPIRPYLSKLAGQYEDGTGKKINVNDYLGYDETTGEVSLGGKNIGKGYSEVDGVTYWDPEELKTRFNEFVKEIGANPNDAQAYHSTKMNGMEYLNKLKDSASSNYDSLDAERKSLNENYRTHYNEIMKNLGGGNPWDTNWGKAIMQGYSLGGAQAAENAMAAAAGSNGGNVDSFATANAARQNLAFETARNNAVMEMYDKKMTNAYNILAALGLNIDKMVTDAESRTNSMQSISKQMSDENQRFFDNGETKRTNDVAIDKEVAAMSGYTDPKYLKANNPYFDENGNVNTDIDYTARIDELTAENARLTAENKDIKDETKKAENNRKIEDNNNLISAARFAQAYKVKLPEYKQWAYKAQPIPREETAERKSLKDTLASNQQIQKMSSDTDKYTADRGVEAQKLKTSGDITVAKIDADGKLAEANANNAVAAAEKEKDRQAAKEAREYNVANGFTPGGDNISKASNAEEKQLYTKLDNISKAVNDSIGDDVSFKSSDGVYSVSPDKKQDVFNAVKGLTNFTTNEKITYLIAAGFSEEEASYIGK